MDPVVPFDVFIVDMSSIFESRCCWTLPTYIVIFRQRSRCSPDRSRCSHFCLNVTYRDDGIGAAPHIPHDILIPSSAPSILDSVSSCPILSVSLYQDDQTPTHSACFMLHPHIDRVSIPTLALGDLDGSSCSVLAHSCTFQVDDSCDSRLL